MDSACFWPENEYYMYQGSQSPSHLAQVLAEETISNRLYSCWPYFWPVRLGVCIENKAMQRGGETICQGWQRMHVFNICLFGARFLCYCMVDFGREITKPALPEAWKMDVSYQLRSLWSRWRREICIVCLPTVSTSFHSLHLLMALSSFLGHCPVHICLLLSKLKLWFSSW